MTHEHDNSKGGPRNLNPMLILLQRPNGVQVHFDLGQIVISPGALTSVPESDVLQALHRHVTGDWGNVSEHDRRVNEVALRDGRRLFSAYRASTGAKFWLITEADRSVTTVLLPSEY